MNISLLTTSVEQLIDGQFKRVIEHIQHEVLVVRRQHWAHEGTRVDLDEPHSQVFVENEIEADDFKLGTCSLVRIQLVHGRKVTVNHQVLHANLDMLYVQVGVLLHEVLPEIILEVTVGYLIAGLELLVVLRVHLVTVVRQVNVLALIAERVSVRARTQIARLI